MRTDRSRPKGLADEPVPALVLTDWSVAVCGACGHEQVHRLGRRGALACADCGAGVEHSFPLYRDLHAVPRFLLLAGPAR
jgi:hypothetical protein